MTKMAPPCLLLLPKSPSSFKLFRQQLRDDLVSRKKSSHPLRYQVLPYRSPISTPTVKMASGAERGELDEVHQPAPEDEQVLAHRPSRQHSSDGSPPLAELSTSTSGSSGRGSLHFVNMSHPEDIRRQSNVQREIRRHVMKGVSDHRGHLRGRRKATSKDGAQSGRQPPHPERLSPSRSLAPLGSFPVQTNTRMLELVRFGMRWNDYWVNEYC